MTASLGGGTGRAPVVRAGGVVGMAWGVVLLVRGRSVWQALSGADPTPGDELAIRFLGARHLAQGALQVGAPTHGQRLYIVVDVIHAATMGALAVADPARRRPAALTGSVALVSAATTLAARAGRAGRAGR